MAQINPPFDGSAPCPMCSQEIRGLSATAHNMLTRWRQPVYDPTSPAGVREPEVPAGHIAPLPQSKFWQRADDLARAARDGTPPADIKTDNAEVRAHLDAIAAVVAEYGRHERPCDHATAHVVADALAPMVEVLRTTAPAVGRLSETHFDDRRHSQGEPNILREQRGYSDDRGGDYAWTVEKVDEDAPNAELRHTVCGQALSIHQYFRERILRDPLWFGQVWCPTCRQNLPWAQFECRVVA